MSRKFAARRLLTILVIVLVVCLSGLPVIAGGTVQITIKTILASQSAGGIDPRLSSLTRELKPVFRYSSYQLVTQNNMRLSLGQRGLASLPGKRMLSITPTRLQGNRVELKLAILRKRRTVFHTVIKLINNGSIIVGGPRFQDGVLMFNISSRF